MEIRFDPTKVLNGLIAAQEKYRRGIELYGKTAALKLEAKAKKDASWTDRTSNARQTIKGVCGWGGTKIQKETVTTYETRHYVTPTGGKWSRTYARSTSIDTGHEGGNRSVFVVAVTGNMEYSPYLELCNKEKYAVLWPTVNAMQGEITNGWAKVLNGVR